MEDAQPTTQEPPARRPLDPLFAIWTTPRATLHRLLDRPEHQSILLAALSGVYGALAVADANNLGDLGDTLLMLGLAVVLGAGGGVLLLYGSARLVEWTGRRLGGVADGQEIRTALAWAAVPFLAGLALYAVQLLFYGEDLFLTLDASPGLDLGLAGFALLRLVLQAWSVVIVVGAMAEAQRLEIWRAVVNLLLTVLALAVLAALLAGPVTLLVR